MAWSVGNDSFVRLKDDFPVPAMISNWVTAKLRKWRPMNSQALDSQRHFIRTCARPSGCGTVCGLREADDCPTRWTAIRDASFDQMMPE